jgi:hypothetical protein
VSRAPWQKLELASSDVAQALETAKAAITPVISITETILKVAQTISQIVYNLYVDISDPSALALKTAIKLVQTEINAMFKDTGIYALPVPIGTINNLGSNPEAFLVNMIEQPPEYWEDNDKRKYTEAQLAAIAASKARSISSQQIAQQSLGDLNGIDLLLAGAPQGNGGNAGFLRTVNESLEDQLDMNRPMFNADDYVGGMVLVYGANSYYDIIKLVKHLAALFTFKVGGLDSPDMPKPKNLTARMQVNPDGGMNNLYAVKLDWEATPIDWYMRAYGDIHYKIREVFVYRSIYPITKKTPISSLLKIGQYEYDGFTSSFYDDTWNNNMLGKALYYAVGYAVDEITSLGTKVPYTEPLEVSNASIQMPVEPSSLVSRGVPPDWSATTLYSLIPPLKEIIQVIKDTLDTWLEGTEGGKDRIKDFLDFLNKEIQRYSNWALEVLGTIDQIVKMFQIPTATMGLYFFEGRGGNAFLSKTLAEALSDTADSNRPAFDTGTEMVGGLVLYVGAAYPGEVQKALTLLKTVFGAEGVIANAVLQAGASIDRILATAEDEIACFSKEMRGIPCETETPATTGFGPDMQPTSEDSLCARCQTK